MQDVIDIEAQAITVWSENENRLSIGNPPEYKDEKTIASQSECTEVEKFVPLWVVLCQLIDYVSAIALGE